MGLLVEGRWLDKWYDTKSTGGRFQRQDSRFRGRVSADSGAEFPAEAGRYHLYVALACPWAHRTLIFRKLMGLEEVIPVSVVHPHMLENGWEFREDHPDHLFGYRYLHQVYTRADPTYTGRVTVPALWDTKGGTIVNNESSEIIRMFNAELRALGRPLTDLDYYPERLRGEIDAVNERVYHTVNNGVYKAGFATTQEAYDEAAAALFDSLDWLEDRLKGQEWLIKPQCTEADWRLFTTLYRFDPVYYAHFKCAKKRIRDYPRLWDLTRRLYNHPGVAETCDLDAIRQHYFYSHATINPNRIVPIEPEIDYSLG